MYTSLIAAINRGSTALAVHQRGGRSSRHQSMYMTAENDSAYGARPSPKVGHREIIVVVNFASLEQMGIGKKCSTYTEFRIR